MKLSPLATFVAIILTVICLITGALFLQNTFLYHPVSSSLESIKARASTKGLVLWPTPGTQAVALSPATPLADPVAVAVVFHGNAGEAVDRSYYRQALEQRGWHIVLAEYPGYSWRTGDVGERALTADAIDLLEQVGGAYPDLPLYVIGESLGAGVGAAAVKGSRVPVAGVALITPWDTLEATAKTHFPAPLVKFLLRDRYDSITNLREANVPVILIVAGADTIIPPARGQALFEALSEPKKLMLLPGVGHNTWPSAVDSPIWTVIHEFFHPTKT